MATTLTLHLDPWLASLGTDPAALEHLDNVRFHENVDYDRATTGPGVGFLRMPVEEWRAIGCPRTVTVTVTNAHP